MSRTAKNLIVKNKSVDAVKKETITILKDQDYRIKEAGTVLTCTRGYGILTAQQKCVITLTQQGNDVAIKGEFFTSAYWVIESTVDENAIAAGIPRRKGYRLMMNFIQKIGAEEV